MRYISCLIAAGIVASAFASGSAQKAKDDSEKLQGTWVLTELIVGGFTIPEKEIKGTQFVFAGNKLTIVPAMPDAAAVDKHAFTFKLDPSQTPAAVDLTAVDGDAKGTVSPGIYELKGDTLRWCQSDDKKNTVRPRRSPRRMNRASIYSPSNARQNDVGLDFRRLSPFRGSLDRLVYWRNLFSEETPIMRRLFLVIVGLAGTALTANIVSAGVRIQPPAVPIRVANTEVAFVGRVTEIEPVDVEAKASPTATDTTKYHIAVVKVNQIVNGLKEEKTLRIAFLADRPKIRPGIQFIAKLEVGQEGLFMLNKHHEGKFYQAPMYGYFISAELKTYEDDVKAAKLGATILSDPKTALQAKDADERFMAAAMQIGKYRKQLGFANQKEMPIDAEESKLILNAIAGAKWTATTFRQPNPQQLFFQLGVGPADGWKTPMKANADEMREAIQDWIKANAGTYRIKKFVAALADKAEPIKGEISYRVAIAASGTNFRTFTFRQGVAYEITVRSEPRAPDVDLYVIDPATNKVMAADASVGPDSMVRWTPSQAGDFRVEVRNLDGATAVESAVSIREVK